MKRAGLAGSAVSTVEEALSSQHARERGVVQEVQRSWPDPSDGSPPDRPSTIRTVAPPIRASKVTRGVRSGETEGTVTLTSDPDACKVRGAPPLLGEHTRKVLVGWGVLDDGAVDEGCREGWLRETTGL